MISIDSMTDEDFERHALAILQRELGLDGGDYTRDRHRWLGATTSQEIMAEVESRRNPAT
jgi:hypothetical protein